MAYRTNRGAITDTQIFMQCTRALSTSPSASRQTLGTRSRGTSSTIGEGEAALERKKGFQKVFYRSRQASDSTTLDY